MCEYDFLICRRIHIFNISWASLQKPFTGFFSTHILTLWWAKMNDFYLNITLLSTKMVWNLSDIHYCWQKQIELVYKIIGVCVQISIVKCLIEFIHILLEIFCFKNLLKGYKEDLKRKIPQCINLSIISQKGTVVVYFVSIELTRIGLQDKQTNHHS